ncbi:MAG: SIR2 family protein [Pseudomonadota bacterium]|nr:SIR2 family protein [Pseudomonadota bacterium]
MSETIHNLDQYMSDLRQILAQGKKRIGILLGAGTPVSINISKTEGKHEPLIPAIAGLTETVKKSLSNDESALVTSVIKSLGEAANIEDILSKIRSLSSALKGSDQKIGPYTQKHYDDAAKAICKKIGEVVNCKLPSNETPYNRLAGWIGGTDREHAVEIFTSNYDLLMEEALENAKIPFFSGFSGFHEPFFDAASISSNDDLPSRWARLWKLHGSLGWGVNEKGELVSGKGREASELIYPDHLKYDHIQKLPYTALFDRLRKFLMTPDTLLLSCGFSYCDSHVSAVINEALTANPAASVFAFLYQEIDKESAAKELALKRSNFSAYACDKAVISCMAGKWELGKNNDNKDWQNIRASFWATRNKERNQVFTLGDFTAFANFFALSKSDQTYSAVTPLLNVERV